MLLNAAKCHGYHFYHFWVIKGEPAWGGGGIKLPPIQIRVKITWIASNITFLLLKILMLFLMYKDGKLKFTKTEILRKDTQTLVIIR